ncbi:MAG: FAD-dependent oxidoreductase [Firmicutes bacterium]|nr:FAD-dependent oxidoreductase [Bacillota bacterium]
MTSNYDVIVVGAGASGAVASIAAARNGCRTLLVEKENCSGGQATAGLLCLWGPFDDGKQRIIRGIPEEILENTIAAGGALPRKHGFIPVNPETLKIILDCMLEEAGAEVLYHSICVEARAQEGLIRDITVANKAGLQSLSAAVYIDATGDGDLAVKAGALWEMGTDPEGFVQPMTMLCRLGGINESVYCWEGNFKYREKILESRQAGEISFDATGIGAAEYIPGQRGVIAVNMSHIFDLDPLSPSDVSKAEMLGRKYAQEIVNFFRKNIPGCENAFLIDTAMQVGVRESRRILGEYTITLEDVISGRRFDDAIAANAYHIDIHTKSKEAGRLASVNSQRPREYYQIPFRALIPKGLSNMLVVGRCISCTSEALASIRIMPCCMATGHAGGTAAALAVKGGIPVREVPSSRLQEKLREENAFID